MDRDPANGPCADEWVSHAASLAPRTDFSRRAVVAGGIAAGFALAVLPVSAETIVTDSKGLENGDVEISVADGKIPGYRAMPAMGGPFPAVLVIQEIFGLHEHIKDICRRLAKVGYFAVAPALYTRQGEVMRMGDVRQIIDQVVSKVPDAQVASDLDATLAWAQSQKAADMSRLGVTGFCWGGRQVWLYAAHAPRLKAAVAWYGPLTGPTGALRPEQPIEIAARLKCPVLGLYGGADNGIPAAAIETMRAALAKARKTGEIIVYPGVPHGFNADYRPSYRADAARDGWKRMLAWFKKYGVA